MFIPFLIICLLLLIGYDIYRRFTNTPVAYNEIESFVSKRESSTCNDDKVKQVETNIIDGLKELEYIHSIHQENANYIENNNKL